MDILKKLPTSIPRPCLPSGCVLHSALGRVYDPTRLLGEGAAGVVYSGQTIERNTAKPVQLVALKILSPLQRIAVSEKGYQRIRSRFNAEARRGRGLSHPNLCRILDYGEIGGISESWDGFPFYVMEFVNGRSLGTELTNAAPAVELRFKWIRQLGEALVYLHGQGVLHRDIKPDNIIISEQANNLILGDFGVVHWDKFFPEYTDQIETYSSEILSTWSYLPPESENRPSIYDLKSEAWAYGKTILEIARWSILSRLMLLMGRDGPHREPYGIESVMVHLLDNDPATRLTVAEAMVDLQPYFDLSSLPASIPEANFQKVKSDIRAYELSSYGPTGKFALDIDKGEMLDHVDRIARNPEEFFSTDKKCPTCGSPLTAVLASYDDTPWDETMHAAFLFGCFGHNDRPCGLFPEAYD